MKNNLCELIASFLKDPKGQADTVRGSSVDIVQHIAQCDSCGALITQFDDVEQLYAALAGETDYKVDEDLDLLFRTDEANQQSVEEAVKEVLLPGLSKPAQAIARNFLPLELYAATEAASVLIETLLDNSEVPNAAGVLLGKVGEVYANTFAEPVISGDEMALEIARFAGLWHFAGSVRQCDAIRIDNERARLLAQWLYLAIQDQPNLLRLFRRDWLPLQLRDVAGALRGRSLLFPLNPQEQIDDPVARWTYGFLQETGNVYVGGRLNQEPSCYFFAPSKSLFDVESYLGEFSDNVAFVSANVLEPPIVPQAALVGNWNAPAYAPEGAVMLESVHFRHQKVNLMCAGRQASVVGYRLTSGSAFDMREFSRTEKRRS